jgi:hypothetical protein
METTERIYNVKELKAKIKVAAAYQIFLKNQRKTEKLVGKREMDPSEATWKHQGNREKLAIMYVAYGVMRGKDLEEQMKAHISKEKNLYAENFIKDKVASLLKEYKLKQVVIEEIE